MRGELVATDEPAAVAKPFLDAIVVEGSQSNGGLANSAGTDESDEREVFRQCNHTADQLATSKQALGAGGLSLGDGERVVGG